MFETWKTQSLKERLTSSGIMLAIIGIGIALVGRIGLWGMDLTGVLTYDYITSSQGTLLNQLCTALTGPALFALLATVALAMGVSMMGIMLYVFAHAETKETPSLSRSLIFGAIVFVISAVALGIMGSGIMSAVQISAMKTKLHSDPAVMLGMLVMICAVITLIAATQSLLLRVILGAKQTGKFYQTLACTVILFGALTCVIAIGGLSAMNVVKLNGMVLLGWMVAGVIINVGALVFAHRGTK